MKKQLALKIILALLPTLILTQNWAWMSMNRVLGFAFLIFWVLMIWQVIASKDKNYIVHRLLWWSEIAFFLLPISAIFLTFGFGSKIINATEGAAQVGAAVGTVIGGVLAIGLGFVIGLFGGFICRSVSKKYAGKITEVENKKEFFTKTKGWAFIAGIIVILIATSISLSGEKNKKTEDNDVVATSTKEEVVNTVTPEKLCPEITKGATAYNFEWAKNTEGNQGLFLSADFVKQMAFGGDYKLNNLPNTSEYFADNFSCQKGSNSGESLNKLYCRTSFMYKPDLRKNNVDQDGNIVSTEDKYITTFIFDATGKDLERVNDLKTLTLDSIVCSNDSF